MKVSSRVRKVVAEMGEQPVESLAKLLRPIDGLALMDELIDRAARLALVEILNLNEDPKCIARMKGRLGKTEVVSVADENDAGLIELRNSLREGFSAPSKQLFKRTLRDLMEWWEPGRTAPSSHLRGEIYVGDWGERRPGRQSWWISWTLGIIRPLPDANFRGTLAWAVIRHGKDLAYCGNPECPAPYYLRRRRDQKYCSANDECARFANREAARRYWGSKGKEKARKSGKAK